ncbi:mechanosensitive ion channel protein 6-like [Nicotiana tabacum]|uniref:Mechanosensitive ion channel protein n=1 Tax=Nicotiana tabacum TaxID=4097 RepID=A0A1S3ZVE3_TOBAC|nr:PREDICTED: mechanosensitive ion channel protein 6-like [Nicotiana tabacum]
MDQLSSSLKKSFKPHSSYKHTKKVSVPHDIENQPILSHQSPDTPYSASSSVNSSSLTTRSSIDLNDRREVIVKIDGGEKMTTRDGSERNMLWHEPSYEFWREDMMNSGPQNNGPTIQRGIKDMPEDPPSKLIGQFLNKQRAVGCEMTLDMDLEMDELRNHPKPDNDSAAGSSPLNFPSVDNNMNNNINNHRYTTSKDLRVSFQAPSPPSNVVDIEPDQAYNDNECCSTDEGETSDATPDEPKYLSRRRTMNINNPPDDSNNSNNTYYTPKTNGGDNDQVLRCTSFQRRASVLGRAKTKSRLIDPPEIPERRSGKIGKSGQIRSGLLGRASGMLKPPEEEDDDPLFDEDLPDEFKKDKVDCWTLLQWISLVIIVTALICTLAIPLLKRKEFRGLHLWKWEVLVLVLICGRLLSGWVIRLVVFFIERNFLLRKRVLYFVYGVRKPVQNCLWLGLVLIAWHFMFDKKVDENNKFLGYINKLMICMLIGTMLWLVKTLMVKVLASSFHVSTFFDRIQESLFNQYVIETLSGPPLIEIHRSQVEEDRTLAEVWKLQNIAGAQLPAELRPPIAPQYSSNKGVSVNGGQTPTPKPSRTVSISISGISGPLSKNQDEQNQGISIDHLHKLNPKNISAWNMKRLIKIVRYGVISTLDEQILDTKREDESTTQIRSEYEAKVAARKIFRNVAKPRSKFIYLDDLRCFLREEEALKSMNLVEGSPDREKISRASLKSWVVNAFRERRALALTLNDTKTAVNKLHQMVNVLVSIIILVICLVILGIATSKFLLFVSSQVVVVAFVFGNTCKTIFESIIFLFVMHPFDVGDRCEVDGVQMIVEEMNILTTVFLRFDNQKIMYPNSTLSTRPIGNYYRSPDMGDSIDFTVHIATPAEKIAAVKQRITSYIESKKDHWYPSPTVVLMNLEDLNRLKMSVWIRHRMNHQDMGERWLRRAQLVEEMVKIFKELDIEYRLYPIDINVRGMPPITSNRIPSTWPTAGN